MGARREQDKDNLQRLALLFFLSLWRVREEWSGKLIVVLRLEQEGLAMCFAARALGAVCLAIDGGAVQQRLANRSGAIDFLVTEVSEALRILKIEVRRGRAAVVGLQADIDASLAELEERGIEPALVVNGATEAETEGMWAASTFAHWRERGEVFCIACDVAASLQERQVRDEALIRTIKAEPESVEKSFGLAWMEAAPRLFRRSPVRWCPGGSNKEVEQS